MQHGGPGLQQGNLSAPLSRTTRNIALFGLLDYDISDIWTVSAEARVAKDKSAIQGPNLCTIDSSYYAPELDLDLVNPVGDAQESKSFTPRFTLRYQGWERGMIYIQAAKGNKPGAFNQGLFMERRDGCFSQLEVRDPNGLAYVEEEKAWTYEVGTKTTWLDRRVTANIAVYYIDWDNLTVFETPSVPFFPVTVYGNDGAFGVPQALAFNAGKARVYGMELETTFVITDNLYANFSYGLVNGEYTEFTSPALADATGIGLDENGDLIENSNNGKGNQLPNSPKHSFVTALTYSADISSSWSWFARTDFILESKRFTSGTNFEQIDNRKVWNARGGFDSDTWKISAYVTNILDRQTPSAILGFPRIPNRYEYIDPNDPSATGGMGYKNGYGLAPTPGRQYGVELIWRFGS
jgi:iron complex outermembrane receptor protein